VLLPWSIYLHTGDRRVPEKFFPAMLRYLDYCREREEADGLLDFGLADWCAPNCIEGRVAGLCNSVRRRCAPPCSAGSAIPPESGATAG
jgi:alpha-L-rhamnosidase